MGCWLCYFISFADFILKEWTLTLPICVGFGFVLGGVLKPLFEKVGALLSTNPKDDLPQWEISRKKKVIYFFETFFVTWCVWFASFSVWRMILHRSYQLDMLALSTTTGALMFTLILFNKRSEAESKTKNDTQEDVE